MYNSLKISDNNTSLSVTSILFDERYPDTSIEHYPSKLPISNYNGNKYQENEHQEKSSEIGIINY